MPFLFGLIVGALTMLLVCSLFAISHLKQERAFTRFWHRQAVLNHRLLIAERNRIAEQQSTGDPLANVRFTPTRDRWTPN